MKKYVLFFLLAINVFAGEIGEKVGAVSTAFKLIGENDQIVVTVFDDPKVQGVSCYISQAVKGGLGGTLGLAEDPSEYSISCRQTGNIKFIKPFKKQEEVYSRDTNIFFKETHIIRMVDDKRKVLSYLTYSDKLIDGSPKNSLSVVPYGAFNGSK